MRAADGKWRVVADRADQARGLAYALENRRNLARIRRAVVPLAGFLLLWWAFYGLGALLLKIPPDFHEGTIWRRLEGEGQP